MIVHEYLNVPLYFLLCHPPHPELLVLQRPKPGGWLLLFGRKDLFFLQVELVLFEPFYRHQLFLGKEVIGPLFGKGAAAELFDAFEEFLPLGRVNIVFLGVGIVHGDVFF